MLKIMLALHLLTAVFAVGPLVHAATTASRGLRRGDAPALAASARMLRIYAIASVAVVVFGFAVMSSKSSRTHKQVAEFSDTWIWLSLLLWVLAMVLVFALIVPALQKAEAALGRSETVAALTGRIAAAGGVVGLIFAAVIFLMVYRPGG